MPKVCRQPLWKFAELAGRREGVQAELYTQNSKRLETTDLSRLLCTDPGDCLGSPASSATACRPDPRRGSCAVLGVAPQVCGRSGTENGHAGTLPRRVL